MAVRRQPGRIRKFANPEKIKKLPADAVSLIRSYKSYRGGNDLLWALNALRKPNIHRHFILSIVAISGYQGRAAMNAGIGIHVVEQPRWNALDREITLFTFTPGAEIEYEVQVLMDIKFCDIEPLDGESVIAVLNQFSGLTKRLLLKFEQQFFT